MLHLIFLAAYNCALTGQLINKIQGNLRLAKMSDIGFVFTNSKYITGNTNSGFVEYDYKKGKKHLKVGGDYMCVSVKNSERILAACNDTIKPDQWEIKGEDGMYKFVTKDNLCLTVGASNKPELHLAAVLPCKPNDGAQEFFYEKVNNTNTTEKVVSDYNGPGNTLPLFSYIVTHLNGGHVDMFLPGTEGDTHVSGTSRDVIQAIDLAKNTIGSSHSAIVDATMADDTDEKNARINRTKIKV